jgi:hypothetical protein
MMHTIPNLVRMSTFPFQEKVLAIDTAPLSGEKTQRPGLGTMEQLCECAATLLAQGVIDRLVDFNYDRDYQRQMYLKHFRSNLTPTHNYKGYPILGSIFKIEECQSDYMVHFDSDMMMYQDPDYSWIADGIERMEKDSDIMFVRPMGGPPAPNGQLLQKTGGKFNSDKGLYEFKFFGSRLYLLNTKRFEKLLPLPIIWMPFDQPLADKLPEGMKTAFHLLTGKGKLNSWELMVSKKLEQTNYWRVNLTDPRAWTLHPKDRSPEFIAALPRIIERIEAGNFPERQAGFYDLISELWF